MAESKETENHALSVAYSDDEEALESILDDLSDDDLTALRDAADWLAIKALRVIADRES